MVGGDRMGCCWGGVVLGIEELWEVVRLGECEWVGGVGGGVVLGGSVMGVGTVGYGSSDGSLGQLKVKSVCAARMQRFQSTLWLEGWGE